MDSLGPRLTISTATTGRSRHGDKGQEHEEEHGEEAGSEDAEGEAASQEGQEVVRPGGAAPQPETSLLRGAARGTRTPVRRRTRLLAGCVSSSGVRARVISNRSASRLRRSIPPPRLIGRGPGEPSCSAPHRLPGDPDEPTTYSGTTASRRSRRHGRSGPAGLSRPGRRRTRPAHLRRAS
jgi:hypothetical protein